MLGRLAGRARDRLRPWLHDFLYRHSPPLRRMRAAGRGRWIDAVPERFRAEFDLDGPVVRPLRVEIGSGYRPTEGWVHVDVNPEAPHLEHVAPAWSLPFRSGSVAELRAVHVLEHIHPADVDRTLREWRRVLEPGGAAYIHVPNFPVIAAAYSEATVPVKWAMSCAIYGGGGPQYRHQSEFSVKENPIEHAVVYDLDLLTAVLEEAGFSEISDLTMSHWDHHNEAWRDLVDRISLIVRASS